MDADTITNACVSRRQAHGDRIRSLNTTIHPLKTGAAMHLTDLSKAAEAKPPAGKVVTQAGPAGVYVPQPQTYKVDSEDLSLLPGDGVEIKYHLAKGAGMLYAWKATGNAAFEFHGEPDQKPNKDY